MLDIQCKGPKRFWVVLDSHYSLLSLWMVVVEGGRGNHETGSPFPLFLSGSACPSLFIYIVYGISASLFEVFDYDREKDASGYWYGQ